MPLPDWLDPLYDSAQQRELDSWAIEELGIPGLELMERAGTGLAELVMEAAPTGRVTVVCGKGNNGGDGFVCARFLRQHGRDVDGRHVYRRRRLTQVAHHSLTAKTESGKDAGLKPYYVRRSPRTPPGEGLQPPTG